MKCISSSIFGRVIGLSTIIEISDNELTIEVKDHLFKFHWRELLAPPQFHLSFFGQILSFKTAKKSYAFTMLAYSSKRAQKNNCQQFWANANIKRVETLLATIQKITINRYLRQSTIQSIQLAVNQEWQRWFGWFSSSELSKLNKSSSKEQTEIVEKLQWLSYYQHWQAQGIADCRESYINKQLQVHKTYFDNVESNPLTQSQRRACIIDNDNNLLLAGAGTGKTSVMVGRAGYLLNSQQAKSEQILLLAYGRKAADEMDERIKDKLSTDEISASTFHSLGLSIITQVEGKKPNLSVFAEDEKVKFTWVENYFKKLINEQVQYRELIVEYFTQYFYVKRSAFDFKSLGDCYQYFNDNDVRTFKGERVNSVGELDIANWLFVHGIEYQFQATYAYDVKTMTRKQYRPNFFLPQHNIYIEYYESDENGNTPTYIDKEAYHEHIKFKRSIHQQFKTECLEFTYAQYKEGKLFSTLMESLIEKAAQLGLLPAERPPNALILTTLNESGKLTALTKTLSQLVGLAKAVGLTGTLENTLANTLKDKIVANSNNPKQTEKALTLLEPILIAYEQHLANHGEIDFENMITKAITYVQTGQFNSPWRYIMVDEFQDISEPRAHLVKALRDNNKECSVFAVGDDWQAIYRFSGADVTLTTQFSTYFGATAQSELDQTFRFNNQIGKVATDFISKNPAQINKSIKSLKQVKTPAVSLLKRESNQSNAQKNTIIDEMANGAVDDVLAAISAQVCKPVNVYLLARYWYLLPNNADLKRLNNQYPLLNIEAQSFHASKGKEADFVVIVGLKKGVHGFPSEKETTGILDALLPQKEAFEYAEERRLFYVALTRAKDRVYLIADMVEASCFVHELIDEHNIELDEFETTESQSFIEDINCLVCGTGVLKKQSGCFGVFYACSHFPRCEHKEKPCVKCESPMTGKRYPGFKFCLNKSCNNLIPMCGQCDAEMILRSSKNGQFWGCQNYKGNEPMSCKNGLHNAKVNWPEVMV